MDTELSDPTAPRPAEHAAPSKEEMDQRGALTFYVSEDWRWRFSDPDYHPTLSVVQRAHNDDEPVRIRPVHRDDALIAEVDRLTRENAELRDQIASGLLDDGERYRFVRSKLRIDCDYDDGGQPWSWIEIADETIPLPSAHPGSLDDAIDAARRASAPEEPG